MKVMIATFGVKSGGITEGIKKFGCEKLILFLSKTPQAKESVGELKKIEKRVKEMNIPMQKVIVSPYALMENVQKIKEYVKSQEGNEVTLNVTGGRKTLCLAATLAGFVSNPKRIVYIPEDYNQTIEIPRFTVKQKFLPKQKQGILKVIGKNTTYEEIEKSARKKYHALMKQLRELETMELIEISKKRPHTYTIKPSGELLRDL